MEMQDSKTQGKHEVKDLPVEVEQAAAVKGGFVIQGNNEDDKHKTGG